MTASVKIELLPMIAALLAFLLSSIATFTTNWLVMSNPWVSQSSFRQGIFRACFSQMCYSMKGHMMLKMAALGAWGVSGLVMIGTAIAILCPSVLEKFHRTSLPSEGACAFGHSSSWLALLACLSTALGVLTLTLLESEDGSKQFKIGYSAWLEAVSCFLSLVTAVGVFVTRKRHHYEAIP